MRSPLQCRSWGSGFPQKSATKKVSSGRTWNCIRVCSARRQPETRGAKPTRSEHRRTEHAFGAFPKFSKSLIRQRSSPEYLSAAHGLCGGTNLVHPLATPPQCHYHATHREKFSFPHFFKGNQHLCNASPTSPKHVKERTQNPVHASECGFKSHLRHSSTSTTCFTSCLAVIGTECRALGILGSSSRNRCSRRSTDAVHVSIGHRYRSVATLQ
jgi:hypothetical protein